MTELMPDLQCGSDLQCDITFGLSYETNGCAWSSLCRFNWGRGPQDERLPWPAQTLAPPLFEMY